ncbi:MAG TPA: hypothetical protein VK983_05110 [Candidatus Limnocylindrales bacterium]|nr:hypothetical protein [Candidatus Limnocylindrales bacterium]
MDFSQYKVLEFRRRFLKVFGAEITIKDPATDELAGFIAMKAWVLREDVRIYRDESKQEELLRIHARTIIDFGATYDVYDGPTDTLLFSFRRKGLASTFVRDNWEILDAAENPIARLQETSGSLALVRRYVGIIPIAGPFIDLALIAVPLTYSLTTAKDGTTTGTAATILHRKNPFIVKMSLDRSQADVELDPRIGVAMTALLSVIDASKN